jgi:hypothetical protein
MKKSTPTDWGNWTFCIRIAGNTWPRSLMAIHQKGYAVRNWCVMSKDEKGEENYEHFYEAKKDGRFFSASTPVELLGLIALWETRGDSWCDVSEEEWAFYNRFEDELRIYDEDGNDILDD